MPPTRNLNTVGKPGVFQPVTGQAVVTQTTCVDDYLANEAESAFNKEPAGRYKPSADPRILHRVESHLLALRRKNNNQGILKKKSIRKGSGTSLKIVTYLNKLEKEDVEKNFECVGVVQTPINPDDRTKPEGFRTCATRMGGTASIINTSDVHIQANTPLMWEAPETEETPVRIKGMPERAVFPVIKPATTDNMASTIYKAIENAFPAGTNQNQIIKTIKGALKSQGRIFGWSLNDAESGHQLDVILRR